MKVSKNEMLKKFFEKIDVDENELDKAREELLKAYQIIDIGNLIRLNKERVQQNLEPLNFEINFNEKALSKIVVDEDNIYYEKTMVVPFNTNYAITSIYSFEEDRIMDIKVTKFLVKAYSGAIGYVSFINGQIVKKECLYTSKKEQDLQKIFSNLQEFLKTSSNKQFSRSLFKKNED